MDKTKTCSKCKEVMPIKAYSKRQSTKDGLCSWCKVCDGIKSRRYYENNKERLVAVAKERNKQNPGALKASRVKHRAKNKEKLNAASHRWYEANKEIAKATGRRWRLNNRDVRKAHKASRRALERGAIGHDYTKAHHIQARWAMWGDLCWMCGKPATTLDHVIPLKPSYREQPGPHLPANLRPACMSCNSSRNNHYHNLLTNKYIQHVDR